MNIAGYTESDFNESNGNAQLALLLQQNKKIKTHFTENDKTPNVDGYFDLLTKHTKKEKLIPKGKIQVQIKTIDYDITNNNTRGCLSKYKYSCDTKIFNVVRVGLILEPAVVLLWDVNNKKAFCIMATYEYIRNLNITNEEEKTLYFGDDQLINNIDDFYTLMLEYYENRKSRVVDSHHPLSTSELAMLQDGSDYLNKELIENMPFMFEKYNKKIWKLGIAYKFESNYVLLAAYIINKGESAPLFSEFKPSSKMNYLSSIKYAEKSKLDILSAVKEILNYIIKNFFGNKNIPLKYYSNLVLEEIAFLFLDNASRYARSLEKPEYPCVYNDDNVSTKELETIWSAFYLHHLEHHNAIRLKKETGKNIIYLGTSVFNKYTMGIDLKNVAKRIEEIIKEKTVIQKELFNDFIIGDKGFIQVKEVIDCLNERGIKKFKRPWKHTDFLNSSDDLEGISGFNRVETGYKMVDYYYNLNKLIRIMPEEYSNSIEKLFPQNSKDLEHNYHIIFLLEQNNPKLSYISGKFEFSEFKTTIINIKKNKLTSNPLKIKSCIANNCGLQITEDEIKYYSYGTISRSISFSEPILYKQINSLIYEKLKRKYGLDYNGNSSIFS